MRCFVLMGVAGCGKSTVGQALSERLDLRYLDGDALHPPANIAKMSSGVPLKDEDREPWLRRVGEALAAHPGRIVIGCSALKRRYRDLIRSTAGEPVGFLHLSASRDVIAGRMAMRTGHFMPETLLASQFADLQPLEADEIGAEIDISGSLSSAVDSAMRHIRRHWRPG